MTLQLAVRLSLDQGNVAAGARGAAAAIDDIGAAGTRAGADAGKLAESFDTATRSVVAAARTQGAAIESIGSAVARAQSTTRRDALGVEITGSPAAIAADTASITAALEAARRRWDPLYAASARYRDLLGEVRAAHQGGAIDVRTLTERETELRIAYERTASAITGRAAAMKAAAERMVADQTIVSDRGADVAAYGAGLDELRAKYNPLWAAGQRYRATVEDIARAERVGAITSTEATAARTRAKEATGAEVEALRRAKGGADDHTAAMRRQAMQAQLLVPQLNDVAVSLAMGMNPLMVGIQQGTQITQIYGGFGNTVKAAAAWLTPMRVGIGLVAGAAVVAAKAAIDYSDGLREADVAARGIGRNAGTTASEIDAIGRSSASAGGVSITSARSMAVAFTRTGKIGSEMFGDLIAMSKDFGATIGQDAATVAQTLGDLVADPARGAQTLVQSYGLLDQTTAHLIERMAQQGRVSEAQATLTSALRQRLISAGDTVAWYTRLWDGLGRAISNAYAETGRMIAGGTSPEEKLQEMLRQYTRLAPSGTGGRGNAVGLRADLRARIDALQQQIDAEKRLAALNRQRALDDQTIEQGRSLAEAGQSPDTRRRQQLIDEIDILRRRQAAAERAYGAGTETRETPALERRLEEATRGTAEAIARRTYALRSWISEAEQARRLAEIDQQMAATRDPIERAQLERRRALVQSARQEMLESEAAAAANQAYAGSIAMMSAQVRGSITDLGADAAAKAKVNALVAAGAITSADANTAMQIEAQTRQLVTAAAHAEGTEKERLLGLASQLRSAILAQAEAERQAQALQDLTSGRDRIETLQTELSLIGAAEPVRARALALLEAEQKIRTAGLSGSMAEQIRAQARATADLTTELERQKAAWGEVQSAGGNAIDTIIDGLRTGEGFGQALADDLAAEMTKLAVTNPIKNMVLGQNLPTLADVGGLFGLGGKTPASAVPSMVTTAQISAATVIVNGSIVGGAAGVGGIAGLTGGVSSVAANGNGPLDLSALMAVNRTGSAAAVTGLDRGFAGNLSAMVQAADAKFGAGAITLNSGYRSVDRQRELWQDALTKYGSPEAARKWVAPPGASQHNLGMAADLGYASRDVASWAQANAGQFGLRYRLGNEPWHIEPAGGAQAAQAQQQLAQSAGQAAQSVGSLGAGATDATKTLMGAGTTITTAGTSLAGSTTQLAGSTQGAFQTLLSGLGGGIDLLLSGLTGIVSRIAGAGGGGGLGNIIGSLFGGSTLATPVIGGLYAGGGRIVGPGTDTSDSIWIAASNDEHIVKASAARKYRPLLDAMNGDRPLPRFAGGGVVGGDRGRMVMTPSARSDGSQGGATVVKLEQRIINTSSARVTTRDESDGRGGRRSVVMIDDMVAGAVGRRGGATDRALAVRDGGPALE